MNKKKENTVKNKQVKANSKKFSTNPSIELKKVTWPNRDTLVKSTILILFLVVSLTAYVSGLDYLFAKLFYSLRNLVL